MEIPKKQTQLVKQDNGLGWRNLGADLHSLAMYYHCLGNEVAVYWCQVHIYQTEWERKFIEKEPSTNLEAKLITFYTLGSR